MGESSKLFFLVRLFVYLLFYCEASPSFSHFESTGAFDYKDRSSEKRDSMQGEAAQNKRGQSIPIPGKISGKNVKTLTRKSLELYGSLSTPGKVPGAPKCLFPQEEQFQNNGLKIQQGC